MFLSEMECAFAPRPALRRMPAGFLPRPPRPKRVGTRSLSLTQCTQLGPSGYLAGRSAKHLHVEAAHRLLHLPLGHPIFDAQPARYVAERPPGERQPVHCRFLALVALVLHALEQVGDHALGGIVDTDRAHSRLVRDGLQHMGLAVLVRGDAIRVDARGRRVRVAWLPKPFTTVWAFCPTVCAAFFTVFAAYGAPVWT